MRDYTAVSYAGKPYTGYPQKLVDYLIARYWIPEGSSVVDVCCGRGSMPGRSRIAACW